MKQLAKVLGSELTQVLQQASHDLSQWVVEHESPSHFSNPKQKAKQLEMQTMESFEKVHHDYQDAAKILVSHLKTVVHNKSDFESILSEFQNIQVDKAHFDALTQQVASQEEYRPQDVFKISAKTIEALYQAADHILHEKDFADALKAFSFLCTIAPSEYRCWVGYGHSAFHTHNYEVSILAYYIATSLQPENPWPLIWIANVCEEKHEFQAAYELLARAKELALHGTDKAATSLVRDIDERLVRSGRK